MAVLEAASLLGELAALPGISAATRVANLDARALPLLPMQIRKDGVALNLFTSIATMGTPHDVTVHELRIESFFPLTRTRRAGSLRGMRSRVKGIAYSIGTSSPIRQKGQP